MFDPNKPDFEKYPRALGARGWECILERGETLYIPPGWYHQVTVLSPGAVNVNFWFGRMFAAKELRETLKLIFELTASAPNKQSVVIGWKYGDKQKEAGETAATLAELLLDNLASVKPTPRPRIADRTIDAEVLPDSQRDVD